MSVPNNRLKGYRVMAGYTQEDFAKILGIDRTAYVYKENGSRKFTDDEKQLIYKELKKKLPNLKIEEVFPVLED